MVWGRELGRLELVTTGGPTWKPLPALLAAPISLVSGGAADAVWLALVRAAALGAVVLAFLLARRLAGTAAGMVAAAGVALSADLYRTALYGSSEPLLIALVLAAALAHVEGRHRPALLALAAAGLIRPEAWAVTLAYAAVLVLMRRDRAAAIASAAVPPAIWLGTDWIGSGSPWHGSDVAQGFAEGTAAHAAIPAFVVLSRAADSLLLPVLLLGALGVALGIQRMDRRILAIAAGAVGWTLIVAALTQLLGYAGSRRYLAAPTALFCIPAGVAGAWLLAGARDGWPRRAVALALVAAVVGFGAVRVREQGRLLGVAREQARELAELDRAVDRLGGRVGIARRGRPVVNAWLQTALAWKLDAPIADVTATWSSSPRRPRWRPPAVVFRAPSHLAGPRPAIPPSVTAARLLRVGRWQVLQARL